MEADPINHIVINLRSILNDVRSESLAVSRTVDKILFHEPPRSAIRRHCNSFGLTDSRAVGTAGIPGETDPNGHRRKAQERDLANNCYDQQSYH